MTSSEKIRPIEEVARAVARLRAEGKRIVYTHGAFDLLHIGHIRHLRQAREMGDVLVVTIVPDRFMTRGDHRPAFVEGYRAEAVASLEFVDFVALSTELTAEHALRHLRPHVFAKGSEFRNKDVDHLESQAVTEVGGSYAFTQDVAFNSTQVINQYLSGLPKEIDEYLSLFRERYRRDDVLSVLDRLSSLRVLVIGDAILDDYQYCRAIGKSSKDPVLALQYLSNDVFAGGILAVANHVAGFAKDVRLFTVVGERDNPEHIIRDQLLPNVSMHGAVQLNAPTIVKRRFLDTHTLNKLFEVYVMDDSGLSAEADAKFCEQLKQELPNYDVVIAADYGHGAISRDAVTTLSEHARFLAVNTQANAGNRGFHTISRYPRADFGCIAEHELKLELRDSSSPLRTMIGIVGRNLNCKDFIVTLGRKGCAIWNRSDTFVEVPPFAQTIVDRVGAGDAFLSVTALASALNVEPELIGFIGNAVGALAVEVVGNRKSVDRASVRRLITSLMG